MNKHYNYTIMKAPIGLIIPIWTIDPHFYLHRIYIGSSAEEFFNDYTNLSRASHPHINQLEQSLSSYFSSKTDIEFPLELLYFETFSKFERSVLLVLKNLSLGQVVSYGQLAEMSGHPKAFRAVGSVMNKNPFPLIIPCHRVIRSNGEIGEFALGKEMKKHLLQHEE
jgi:methylated-DNA-[protein]-cysteine S-methyltransferase